MQMTLLDTLAAMHLTSNGLAAPVTKLDSGVTQVDANYSGGVAGTTYASLSGLGQLLSATSLFSGQLTNTTNDQASTIDSSISVSNPSAVTASITDGTQATTASFAVSVTQLATPQIQKSIYFASESADYLGAGSFQIQTAQGATTVTAATGSLTDIASAINGASAGVNASITNEVGSGYQLVLTASQTGTSGNFVVFGSQDNPLNVLATHLSQLGMVATQTAGEAAYSVNGGSAQTSQNNTGIALDNAVTANLVATGNSTISVTAAPTATTSYANVLSTANALVSQFNAYQSTFNQLLGPSGALNGNTAASNTQSQFSALVGSTLAQNLGLGNGTIANTTQLNATTLSAAYAANATDTIANLNTLVDSIRVLSQSTLTGSGSGSVNASVNDLTYSVKTGISATLSGATTPIPTWVVDYLTNHAVTSNSGLLPVNGFSTYV